MAMLIFLSEAQKDAAWLYGTPGTSHLLRISFALMMAWACATFWAAESSSASPLPLSPPPASDRSNCANNVAMSGTRSAGAFSAECIGAVAVRAGAGRLDTSASTAADAEGAGCEPAPEAVVG